MEPSPASLVDDSFKNFPSASSKLLPVRVLVLLKDDMAALRVPALRHIVAGQASYLRASQRRWAQVHDICALRFLNTQPEDRILEKYKEKLARKARM